MSERTLCALVGELSVRPLERSRPLWNLYAIEGLCGGLVALVLVVHIGLADPRECARLLSGLLGLEPGRRPRERRAGAAARSALEPARDQRRRAPRTHAEPARCGTPGDDAAQPGDPHRRRWGGVLTRSRASAYARSHHAAIDVVRRAFGGTREDVALAACTRALRRHLQAHGDAVDQPLVAALPIGSRCDDHDGRFVRLVRLPVHVQDPVDQLRMVQSETHRARVAEREVATR